MKTQMVTCCPHCPNHCPIDAVQCERGRQFVASLATQRQGVIEPAAVGETA